MSISNHAWNRSFKDTSAWLMPVVEVYRGPYLEAVHAFSVCAVRADGAVLYAIGDIERTYPIHSLAKPFIASELVRCGAADAFDFGSREVAVTAGSHAGEPHHIEMVRSILQKVGLDEEALQCGPAYKDRVVVGPPVANNCSGKHAAVLAMCCHLGFLTDNYISPEHPIQCHLQPRLMRLFGRTIEDTPFATDGCGMPVFGTNLREIATAYARFGVTGDAANTRVRRAMMKEPDYVGGRKESLDTRIIRLSGGSILGKIGAEGLHADAFCERGIGIAIKIHDGNARALPPIIADMVQRFAEVPPVLAEQFAQSPVYNAAGTLVGTIRLSENV